MFFVCASTYWVTWRNKLAAITDMANVSLIIADYLFRSIQYVNAFDLPVPYIDVYLEYLFVPLDINVFR